MGVGQEQSSAGLQAFAPRPPHLTYQPIFLDFLTSARVTVELPELVRSFQILIPAADSLDSVPRVPAPPSGRGLNIPAQGFRAFAR